MSLMNLMNLPIERANELRVDAAGRAKVETAVVSAAASNRVGLSRTPNKVLSRRLLRRLASTPHGVDVADGGSKPPQPMVSKQPPRGGASQMAACPTGIPFGYDVLRKRRLG